MAQRQQLQRNRTDRLGVIAGFLLAISPTIAGAQIAGDGTVRTQVNGSLTAPCIGVCTINGGVERGTNLFHSFREFSIPTGGQAWFNNAPQIQNILTRVTGNSISNIDGLIKANGNANLFFLNPNGIVFGPHAQLKIGGSFFASTASSFQFADGSEFSATHPQAPPLLMVNVPLGLQYSAGQSPIEIEASLIVENGQRLVMMGSDVTHRGKLIAPGGQVDVLGNRVALLDNSQIDVSSSTGGGTVFIGGNYKGQGNLPNALYTYVAPTVMINADATSQGNGGTVVVWADDTTRFHGTISARGGTLAGNGGSVEVSGARSLIFNGRVDTSAPVGLTGTLLLDPANITVVPGNTPNPPNAADGIWAATEDPGNQTIGADAVAALWDANALTLEATDSIAFTPNANVIVSNANTLTLHARTIALTNVYLIQEGAGNVVLDTTQNRGTPAQTTQGTSVIANNSLIGTDNSGSVPKTGDLRITTGSLTAISGAQLTASTFGTGNAGNVQLTVSDVASFDGRSPDDQAPSGAFSEVLGAEGRGGSVELTAGSLIVTNGAQLSASTYGTGDAGSVKLTVDGAAIVDGVSPNASPSLVRSDVGQDAIGQGGDVELAAGSLAVTNGAQLTANTFGVGNAGSIKLRVSGAASFDGTTPDGRSASGAFSLVGARAKGRGGNVELTAGLLTVRGGAQLAASTAGIGDAGNFKLTVTGAATFDGTAPNGRFTSGVRSGVRSGGNGSGGNIELTSGALSITNGAQLSTSTAGIGDAGNLKLTVTGAAIFDGTALDSQFVRFPSGVFSAVQPRANGNGGRIELIAGTLSVTNGAQLFTGTAGIGDAGNLKLTVTGTTNFDGTAPNGQLRSAAESTVESGGNGNGGNVELTTGTLSITNGAGLSASTLGMGDAGSVKLTVNGAATFDGTTPDGQLRSAVESEVGLGAKGRGGNVELTASTLSVTNGAGLNAGTLGTGDAGSVKLTVSGAATFDGTTPDGQSGSAAVSQVAPNAKGQGGNVELTVGTLSVTNGSYLSSSTFGTGDAGSVKLTVSGAASFDGAAPNGQFTSAAASEVAPGAIGRGGNVELTASTLSVTNGAGLIVSTFGSGDAGSIKLTVSGTATFDGTTPDRQSSSEAASQIKPGAKGQGGNVELTAGSLSVTNGARLNASTFGTGDAGNVTLNVHSFNASAGGEVETRTFTFGRAGNIVINALDNITLSGQGTGIFASTASGSTGDGGNIVIDPRLLQIENGATIAVTSQGSGTGGSIKIQAGRLELRDRGSITAETASAQGGNITLDVKDLLLLRHNSLISATAGTAQAGGNGGNITIRAPFIVGVSRENSDITANAFRGNGGTITINTNAIFGLQYRPQLTPLSDITASSQFGLSGTVAITTLNVDPNRGLVALPVNFTDPSQQISQECKPGSKTSASSFVAIGRGGIPLSPDEPLESPAIMTKWVPLPEEIAEMGRRGARPVDKLSAEITAHNPFSNSAPNSQSPKSLVEAQEWIVKADGSVELVANELTSNFSNVWIAPPACETLQDN